MHCIKEQGNIKHASQHYYMLLAVQVPQQPLNLYAAHFSQSYLKHVKASIHYEIDCRQTSGSFLLFIRPSAFIEMMLHF